MKPARIGAAALRSRKGARFAVVTAYDAPFAGFAEEAGIDCILVGDSLGMVVLGYDSTIPVELSDMVRHAGAVVRGTTKAHIMVDLPFGSFEASDADAVRAATALIKAGACSVKVEGGVSRAGRIQAITAAGIPVVGHLGVLPQTAGLDAGFGRKRNREQLLADTEAILAAGVSAIVLEMVDGELAREITEISPVPTIGIGSGKDCDGQVLVMHDILGLYGTPPPFAKKYADLGIAVVQAFRAYAEDVRSAS
jgi:3-methyl-2-oxobutanoate hydroxymethyltransferase